jgi:hypothetical protein
MSTSALVSPATWVVAGGTSQQLLTVDHYVRVRSTAPALAGQISQIYVRERAAAGTVLGGEALAGRVVLFVHGAGTPAEVAFDVPSPGYSWTAYLASARYDVFAMDLTERRDPALLRLLRRQALVPLTEMALWKNEGHAMPAFAGRTDDEIRAAWGRGQRQQLIEFALRSR